MPDALCVISTKAPFAGQSAREALDSALVAASYDIPTSILLMGDGVYQLLKQQQPEHIPRKNLSSMFQALSLYGIETVYVDQLSLSERNLNQDDLQVPVSLLSQEQISPFLQQHPKVLSF
ncbi:hypothetical protein ACH42_05295 [Endozoicomonas sp. (ex Bugula neritina AB1)]|nr:hypothetical protein ACH42_05295 [Endozoicomonas sp. (ex Bugula neritina AB1)]